MFFLFVVFGPVVLEMCLLFLNKLAHVENLLAIYLVFTLAMDMLCDSKKKDKRYNQENISVFLRYVRIGGILLILLTSLKVQISLLYDFWHKIMTEDFKEVLMCQIIILFIYEILRFLYYCKEEAAAVDAEIQETKLEKCITINETSIDDKEEKEDYDDFNDLNVNFTIYSFLEQFEEQENK